MQEGVLVVVLAAAAPEELGMVQAKDYTVHLAAAVAAVVPEE
jgi:hypothetical protein